MNPMRPHQTGHITTFGSGHDTPSQGVQVIQNTRCHAMQTPYFCLPIDRWEP